MDKFKVNEMPKEEYLKINKFNWFNSNEFGKMWTIIVKFNSIIVAYNSLFCESPTSE